MRHHDPHSGFYWDRRRLHHLVAGSQAGRRVRGRSACGCPVGDVTTLAERVTCVACLALLPSDGRARRGQRAAEGIGLRSHVVYRRGRVQVLWLAPAAGGLDGEPDVCGQR